MKSVNFDQKSISVYAGLLQRGWHIREVKRGNYTQFIMLPMNEKDQAVWTKLRDDPNLTLDEAAKRYYSIQ